MSQHLPTEGDAGAAPDQQQQPGRRSGAGASTAMEAMLGKRGTQAREPAPPPEPTAPGSSAPCKE